MESNMKRNENEKKTISMTAPYSEYVFTIFIFIWQYLC